MNFNDNFNYSKLSWIYKKTKLSWLILCILSVWKLLTVMLHEHTNLNRFYLIKPILLVNYHGLFSKSHCNFKLLKLIKWYKVNLINLTFNQTQCTFTAHKEVGTVYFIKKLKFIWLLREDNFWYSLYLFLISLLIK